MAAGYITERYDSLKCLIYVKSEGIIANPTMRTHFAQLAVLMNRCRKDIGFARIISDMNSAAVQTQETADMIASFMLRNAKPNDRIAVLVGSSLAKMQIRRVLSGCEVEAFLSPSAAEKWVMAA